MTTKIIVFVAKYHYKQLAIAIMHVCTYKIINYAAIYGLELHVWICTKLMILVDKYVSPIHMNMMYTGMDSIDNSRSII